MTEQQHSKIRCWTAFRLRWNIVLYTARRLRRHGNSNAELSNVLSEVVYEPEYLSKPSV